jgi:biopolymer transport protein TolR
MRRYSKRRRRERTAINDISLTPLIDTALTLLIIFMVAAPMMQNAISVTLPKGQKNEVGSTPQELVVYIDKQNKHFLDGKPYAKDMLIKQLQKHVGNGKERTVFVKADQAASYGNVIELVDQIKVVGGVKYVALATQKRAQAA